MKKYINIIKGTTPVIRFLLRQTDPADITDAYLTIRDAMTTLSKGFSAMETGEDYIQWKLTQAETLALTGETSLQMNFLTSDGTRGASQECGVILEGNLKAEVISNE